MACLLCERVLNTKKNLYPYLIHEFKNSYLYLGEHQYYRGYCVLVSKEHHREMIDLSEIEREELFREMMKAHEVISKVFEPKKMNLCSLGNVVDHIHWHFFPRYESDPEFKNPPWLQMNKFDSAKVSPAEREKLIEMLKANFKLM
jgi:diadenosine tetraphosphate (Ap4A) HIT family hydrolase